MVRASETFLIELTATGNAEKAIANVGKEAERTSQKVSRSSRRARTSQERFNLSATQGERSLKGVAAAGALAAAGLGTTSKAATTAAGALGATASAGSVAGGSLTASKALGALSSGGELAAASLVRVRRAAVVAGGAVSVFGGILVGASLVAARGFISTAAEAEATAGKFDVVFADLAGRQRARSRVIADEYARAFDQVLATQASFQDTFVPFGFDRSEGAELSDLLTTLTIDLGSFYDRAEPEVLADLQSALVGNVETLRKYGVVINQTVLGQELLAQGVEGGVEAATEQQKVLARLAILIRGTSDAQGDAQRTADEWNNQQRALNAALREESVILGNFLIGQIQDAVDELGGMDRVVTLVTVGMRFLAVTSSLVVEAVGEAAEVFDRYVQLSGGADAATRDLADSQGFLSEQIEDLGTGLQSLLVVADVVFKGLDAKAATSESRMTALGSYVRTGFSLAILGAADATLLFVDANGELVEMLTGGLAAALKGTIRGFASVSDASADIFRVLGQRDLAAGLEGAAISARVLADNLDFEAVVGGGFDDLRSELDQLSAAAANAAFDEAAIRAEAKAAATEAISAFSGALESLPLNLALVVQDQLFGGNGSSFAGRAAEVADEVGDSIYAGLVGERERIAEAAGLLGDAISEGVGAGSEDALTRLEGVLGQLGARILREQTTVLAQTATFEQEYATLWGRVALTTEEQVAAIQQSADADRERIAQLVESNRLLAEQGAILTDLVDRVEAEGVAKARNANTTSEFADTVRRAGDQALSSFAGSIADAVVQLDLAQLSVTNLAQSIIQDLVRAVIQAAIIQTLTGGLGSLGGGTGFLGLFAGGGVVPGGSKPVDSAGAAVATGASLAQRAGLPFNAYAGGGVVDSPQLFVAGEGPTKEAIVPMPNGAVPVKFVGGQGSGGGPLVLQMHVSVSSFDGADAERVFRKNAPEMVRAISSRLESDATFRRSIGRAARS